MSATATTAARRILAINTAMTAILNGWSHIDSATLTHAASGVSMGMYKPETLEALAAAFGEWQRIAADASFRFGDAQESLNLLLEDADE